MAVEYKTTEAQRARAKAYYMTHRDTVLAQQKVRYLAHRDEIMAQQRTRNADRKDEIKEYDRKYWIEHKDKRGAQKRDWYIRNARHQASYKMERTYGITLDDYDAMFEKQEGCCAVCGRIWVGGKRLHVDHDHKTGKVRGLLCSNCNTAIGLLGDDPEIHLVVYDYLTGDKNGS